MWLSLVAFSGLGLKAEYINGRTAPRLEVKNTRKKNDWRGNWSEGKERGSIGSEVLTELKIKCGEGEWELEWQEAKARETVDTIQYLSFRKCKLTPQRDATSCLLEQLNLKRLTTVSNVDKVKEKNSHIPDGNIEHNRNLGI